MSGEFKLPPIRRPGKDPEPDASRTARDSGSAPADRAQPDSGRRPTGGRDRTPPDRARPDRRTRPPADNDQPDPPRDRTPPDHGRRPPEEGARTPDERSRTPDERTRTPESGQRPGENRSERTTVDRAAANPRTAGPWVTLAGRVVREPQSVERPKPSAAPILVALVLLALGLLLPYVLMSLGYVVIGLLVLVLVARRLPFGAGSFGGSRRDGQERPRILVTNFRVGIPKPDDPRAVGAMLSCRLLTRQIDGAVELSSGDDVTLRGWRGGGGLVHVQSLTVAATRSTTKAAAGASPTPVAVIALILVVLAAGALWANRAWLAPEVLAQAVGVVQQSIVSLITLVVIVLIMWFALKKLIFRR